MLWHLHNHLKHNRLNIQPKSFTKVDTNSIYSYLKNDWIYIQPSSFTDVDTVNENPLGRTPTEDVEAWEPIFSQINFVTSSLFMSPCLVSGHKILAMPRESFIMYSLRAHKAVTTMPWDPGPLASQLAGRRPESFMTVFSCVAIKCLSQLLKKGLSRFSIYLKTGKREILITLKSKHEE